MGHSFSECGPTGDSRHSMLERFVATRLARRSRGSVRAESTIDSHLVTQTAVRQPARLLALAGYFGTGNLGNDGSLAAMLGMLRSGTVEGWQGSAVCVTHAP